MCINQKLHKILQTGFDVRTVLHRKIQRHNLSMNWFQCERRALQKHQIQEEPLVTGEQVQTLKAVHDNPRDRANGLRHERRASLVAAPQNEQETPVIGDHQRQARHVIRQVY